MRTERKFKATTDSGHSLPVAGNIIGQCFKANAPNQVWVTDITYIPTGEGWLYRTLKNELVHHCRYVTKEEAVREITEYIEVFYNRQRKQKKLGGLSPATFEQRFYRNLLAA